MQNNAPAVERFSSGPAGLPTYSSPKPFGEDVNGAERLDRAMRVSQDR
jgi:hypothetical protein